MLGLEPYSEMDKRKSRAPDRAARIEYKEAHARLLFGSHETSPIIWIGEPALSIQS
jgi:hypothetical protein